VDLAESVPHLQNNKINKFSKRVLINSETKISGKTLYPSITIMLNSDLKNIETMKNSHRLIVY
jgi:hypothetical protein